VRPDLIVGCSGSAIWGSMWAAGLSAQQIAGFSLAWRPQDYLDVQWLKLPRFALSALRGFSGLAKATRSRACSTFACVACTSAIRRSR
jgi:hypothetical protein